MHTLYNYEPQTETLGYTFSGYVISLTTNKLIFVHNPAYVAIYTYTLEL